jgi:hypothetical protein
MKAIARSFGVAFHKLHMAKTLIQIMAMHPSPRRNGTCWFLRIAAAG